MGDRRTDGPEAYLLVPARRLATRMLWAVPSRLKEREQMAKQSTTTRKQAGAQRPKRRKAESAPSQNGQDVSSFEQELAEYLQERIKPGLNSGAIPMLARSIAKDIARRSSDDAENGDDVDSTEAEADDDQVQAEADDTDVEETEDDYTEAEADDDEAEAEADDDEEAEADDDTEAEADDDYDEADDDTEAEADDDYEDEGEADDEQAAEANGNGSTDFEAAMRELQGELGDDWILRFSVQGDESWLTAEKDDGSQRVQAATASVLSEVVELLNEDG
jgi:hypothetical protein